MEGSPAACAESARPDLGERLGLSVVLYSGESAFALSDHVAAVPLTLFFS
jgi:hypothetical protein